MNIKENFYSKLHQIRESAEQLDEISGPKAREDENNLFNKSRKMIVQSKVDRWSR